MRSTSLLADRRLAYLKINHWLLIFNQYHGSDYLCVRSVRGINEWHTKNSWNPVQRASGLKSKREAVFWMISVLDSDHFQHFKHTTLSKKINLFKSREHYFCFWFLSLKHTQLLNHLFDCIQWTLIILQIVFQVYYDSEIPSEVLQQFWPQFKKCLQIFCNK